MFPLAIEQQFKQHALEQYPKEACGLVLHQGANYEFMPMVNHHMHPHKEFRMDDRVLLPLMERVAAVLHSHTGIDEQGNPNSYPSQRDMQAQEAWAKPWGIVHINEHRDFDGVFYFGDQVPVAPYVGRKFRLGVHDCYTLGRDYYRQEKGVLLPMWPRHGEWWRTGEAVQQNIIERNFAKLGFVTITKKELQKDDVLLCRVNRPSEPAVTNHIAIMQDNGLILHHMYSRLSRPDPVEAWLATANVCLRYVGKAGAQ